MLVVNDPIELNSSTTTRTPDCCTNRYSCCDGSLLIVDFALQLILNEFQLGFNVISCDAFGTHQMPLVLRCKLGLRIRAFEDNTSTTLAMTTIK